MNLGSEATPQSGVVVTLQNTVRLVDQLAKKPLATTTEATPTLKRRIDQRVYFYLNWNIRFSFRFVFDFSIPQDCKGGRKSYTIYLIKTLILFLL